MSDSVHKYINQKHIASNQLSVIPENNSTESDPAKEKDDDSFIFEVADIDDYFQEATSVANMLDFNNDDRISINSIEELLSIVPLEHRKCMGYFLLDCAKQNMKPIIPKSFLTQCILNASASNDFQIIDILKSLPNWKKPIKRIRAPKQCTKPHCAKKTMARNALTDYSKKYSTMPMRCATPSVSAKEKAKFPRASAVVLDGKRKAQVSSIAMT